MIQSCSQPYSTKINEMKFFNILNHIDILLEIILKISTAACNKKEFLYWSNIFGHKTKISSKKENKDKGTD